jgi:hypothetical protein
VRVILGQLEEVHREVRLDREGREATKHALMAVHQAAYRLGYAAGLRYQRKREADHAA